MGGDDSTHDHITRTDSMMPGFWKDPIAADGEYSWEYDWSQDENQRNVLTKCLETYGDGMLVEAFSNSPPYFMTNSGCSSGAKMAFQNNLKEDAYEMFAKYLADVAALDEAGENLTIVMINQEAESQSAWIDLSAFGEQFADVAQVRVIRTSGSMDAGEHWAELPMEATIDSGLKTTLAPWSITTYLVEGAEVK